MEKKQATKIGKPRSSQGLAVMTARLMDTKLAHDIVILEIKKIDGSPTDYFVLCSCDSEVQIRAVVDTIEKQCVEFNMKRPRLEGMEACSWVLLDFFDVVCHVMLPDARNFYKLEKLWSDGTFYVMNEEGKAVKTQEISKYITGGENVR